MIIFLKKNIIKHYDNIAFNKEAAWIIAWELKDSCILIKCVAETIENNDVNALKKKAAKVIKNNDISALSKEAA